MSVNVAGFHRLVLAATEGMGAPINAWAGGTGGEPPVWASLVSSLQFVGVDCTPIESCSQNPGLQVGISQTFMGACTPGLSPLNVQSVVSAFAQG